MFTPEIAARMYGLPPLIDYGSGRGRGVLVASGSGIMMAVMDSVPSLRWCVDVDAAYLRKPRLVEFVDLCLGIDSYVALAGWFSISDPSAFVDVATKTSAIVYARGNVAELEGQPQTMGALIAACNAASGTNSPSLPLTAAG